MSEKWDVMCSAYFLPTLHLNFKYLVNENDFPIIYFQCDIDVYHDVEQRIIYLHLVSVYDVSRLLQLCKQAPPEAQNAVSCILENCQLSYCMS